MSQMSTAIGRFTWLTCARLSHPTMPGVHAPTPIPAAMQSATQRDRYRSNRSRRLGTGFMFPTGVRPLGNSSRAIDESWQKNFLVAVAGCSAGATNRGSDFTHEFPHQIQGAGVQRVVDPSSLPPVPYEAGVLECLEVER